MAPRLVAVVVESRLLVRESLKSRVARQSDRVVCELGSTAATSAAAVSDEPKLVILGAQSADEAVADAATIRKLWPDSKIILLYEHASAVDFQKLPTSQIKGCVSLLASPGTLTGIIDLIGTRDARILVLPDAQYPAVQPAQPEKLQLTDIKLHKFQSDPVDRQDVSVSIRATHTKLPTNGASTDPNLSNSDTRYVPSHRNHSLSEREVQILNGLVKGHSNKVIARTRDIAEATVKVHIKSILRKIRVRNRTQAAVWALESGHAAAEFKGRPQLTRIKPPRP